VPNVQPWMPLDVLAPLLDHLAMADLQDRTQWQQWQIERIRGGANNVLYRVTSEEADLAVKFTIRDARDRAGREYGALLALQQVGLNIAPKPLLLERERFPQPVVVQQWLAGTVLDEPPVHDEEWGALLEHLCAIHSLTPDMLKSPLPPVVLTMLSAAGGRTRIQENVDRIPPNQRPKSLQMLLTHLDRTTFPAWGQVQPHLCRGDCNANNFLRRTSGWASVDWEYSGWGDSAFELADLLTAPSFRQMTPARRQWVIDTYSARSTDPAVATRIRTYYRLMLVWWVTRFARSLYEIPLGRDQRLASRSPNWQEENEAAYESYLQRAWEALS